MLINLLTLKHLTYTHWEFKSSNWPRKLKITKRSPTKKQEYKSLYCIYKYESGKESNTLDRTANCYTDIIQNQQLPPRTRDRVCYVRGLGGWSWDYICCSQLAVRSRVLLSFPLSYLYIQLQLYILFFSRAPFCYLYFLVNGWFWTLSGCVCQMFST